MDPQVIDRLSLKIGEAVNVRVTIKKIDAAAGSLGLFDLKELPLPRVFEQYLKSKQVLNDEVIYEWSVVPRQEGDYPMPPLRIDFF